LKIFENKGLRRICRLKREEVSEAEEKYHTELHNPYSLMNIIRVNDETHATCSTH